MALSKPIDARGACFTYWRVARIDTTVNAQVYIELTGYLSQDARQSEKTALVAGDFQESPITGAAFYRAPYADGMTAEEAYEFVKQQPEFSGAADVWDEGQEGA